MLRELLRADSQRDPHHWVATLAGHVYVGIVLWGIVAMGLDMWTAALIVPPAYFVLWEGLQFWMVEQHYRTRALFWDGVLDAVGVAFGCFGAAFLGLNFDHMALICFLALMPVAVVGWFVREARRPC